MILKFYLPGYVPNVELREFSENKNLMENKMYSLIVVLALEILVFFLCYSNS